MLDKKGEFFVYNQGVSGDTTEDLLKRIEIESSARDPFLIIISMGDNDSLTESAGGKNLVSLEKYGENIKKIISISKKHTNKLVFLGLKKIDEEKTNPVSWGSFYYTNANISKYNNKLKDVCKTEGIEFLDMFELLSEKDFEDGLHPNSKGHEKIFRKVMDFLILKRWVF